jgi:hypothetical protein
MVGADGADFYMAPASSLSLWERAGVRGRGGGLLAPPSPALSRDLSHRERCD